MILPENRFTLFRIMLQIIRGRRMNFRTIAIAGAPLGTACSGLALAKIIRHPIPNSNFPIAQAVQVPGNATTYYVSGQVPPVANKDADPSSREAYGDTKAQTVGVT